MRIGRSVTPGIQARVVLLTADDGFEEQVRATFGGSDQIGLDVIKGRLSEREQIDVESASVVVADLDAGNEAEMQALDALVTRIGNWPPVVAITQAFDESVARRLMQMRVADFMVKLVQTCARVAKKPANTETSEAQIFTFLPAVGGAGVTTLAVQTAMLLLNSG